MGFSIYIAKLFGSGEYRKIRRAVALSFAIQLAFTAVMVAVCLGFHKQIFRLLNVEETLTEEAYAYYSVYVAGLCFIVFNHSFLCILNAFGIGGFQLWMSVAATVLNIGGNILLVKMGMGVRGLAISSVFAGVAVDILYIFKLRSCYKEMGVADGKFSAKAQEFGESFAYSMPNMAQQMVMYLSSLLLSPLVNGLGKEAPAAYSVALTIFNLIGAVYSNSSKALSNYAAQCMGVQKIRPNQKGTGRGGDTGAGVFAAVSAGLRDFPAAGMLAVFQGGRERNHEKLRGAVCARVCADDDFIRHEQFVPCAVPRHEGFRVLIYFHAVGRDGALCGFGAFNCEIRHERVLPRLGDFVGGGSGVCRDIVSDERVVPREKDEKSGVKTSYGGAIA